MTQIMHLPDEVLEFILSLLPPYGDLDSCACVCRRFNELVQNVRWQASQNLIRGIADFRLCWKAFEMHDDAAALSIPRVGRYSHSVAVHRDTMYVFGGGTSTSTTFNDIWRFDLSKRKWMRPQTTGQYPSPKACASMVCHRDRLILFGGWRPQGGQQQWHFYNELHVYDILANRWTFYRQQDETGAADRRSPPPMARHSATVSGDEMIVFGGHQRHEIAMVSSNDVWRLDLNTFRWRRQETSNPKPSARYGQAQVQLDEHNILIYGGCGGPNNIFRDAWLLIRPREDNAHVWQWRQVAVNSETGINYAVHIWCNPVVVVDQKLLVLGPTRANDFQIVKEASEHRPQPSPDVRDDVAPDLARRFMREENPLNNARNPVRNVENRPAAAEAEQVQLDREHDNVAHKLQRSAAARRPMPLPNLNFNANMPQRFDEAQNAIQMAAFNDDRLRQNPFLRARDLQLERLNRLNEAMKKVRQRSRAQSAPSPTPKRQATFAKRTNLLALHVCDLSRVLNGPETTGGGTITWLAAPANAGCFEGAPEKLILYSLVAGRGELIMFGGLVKESLNSDQAPHVTVSNRLHFLTVPKYVI